MPQGPFALEPVPRNLTSLENQTLEALSLLLPPSKRLHSGLAWYKHFQQVAGVFACARGLLARGCLAILNPLCNRLPHMYSFNFQSFKKHLQGDSCFIFKQSWQLSMPWTSWKDKGTEAQRGEAKCPRSHSNALAQMSKILILQLPVLGSFFYYTNIFKWCFVLKFPHLALMPHEMAVCKVSTVEGSWWERNLMFVGFDARLGYCFFPSLNQGEKSTD